MGRRLLRRAHVCSSGRHRQPSKAQAGRYILFPNAIERVCEDPCFIHEIQPLGKDDSCIVGRVVIPAEHKGALMRELELAGINEATMFPDSIDRICHYIKESFL